MPIEHIGIGVPDVEAAKRFFDELMPMVGFLPCFGNGYCPENFQGAQMFLYESKDPQGYSRHRVGLQHLAFMVDSRDVVHQVHEWATKRGREIVREPKPNPQYGPNCFQVFFLDPHGFMIEVVTHQEVDE